MTERRIAVVLREHGATVAVALVLLGLIIAGSRLASQGKGGGRQKPPVRMITAEIKTPPPREPPPPPKEEPRAEEPRAEPLERLVEVKATDVPPPEGPKAEPASGQMAMAGDATGPGDAFGLEGSRSTRSLVGSGGVGGGGGGAGIGEGGDPNARFGWYFRQIASSIQGAFQRNRRLQFAEARVEIRIWVSPSGEVERVQLLRSTGDEELDRAIEGVRGVKLRDALPPDLPNPAVYRFTARKVR